MKYKTLIKFIYLAFLVFSACEIKWDMEMSEFERKFFWKVTL